MRTVTNQHRHFPQPLSSISATRSMHSTGGRLTADADTAEEGGALCVLVTVAPAESVVVTTTAATVVVVAIAAVPFDPDIGTTTVVLLT